MIKLKISRQMAEKPPVTEYVRGGGQPGHGKKRARHGDIFETGTNGSW